MTTNVKIQNVETSHREVIVRVGSNPDLTLQPGQETIAVVYPGQDVAIIEGGVDAKADEAHSAAQAEAEKPVDPAPADEKGGE